MKRLFPLFALLTISFVGLAQTPLVNVACAPNEILYITKYGRPLQDFATEGFGGQFVSNTYENGIGRIIFESDVKQIPERAFRGCKRLEHIKLPESVALICSEAFVECQNLESIIIPKSVSEIGPEAFNDCSGLNIFISDIAAWYSINFVWGEGDITSMCPHNLYLNGTLVSDLIIPQDITLNKNWTFANCESLKSVTISEGVAEIPALAFLGCSNLNSITIPEGVTDIGVGAFEGCLALTSINIPNSIKRVGYRAFLWCENLDSIYISDLGAWCEIEFEYGCLWSAYNLYLNGELITDFVIPNGTTAINDWAFWGCKKMKSITIPNSISYIGYRAFDDCTNLEKIDGKFASNDGRCLIVDGSLYAFAPVGLTSYTLPDHITKIEDGVFSDHSELKSITIPGSVTEIGIAAFSGCASLECITIPDNVTSIGKYTFNDCQSLKCVYCKPTTPPQPYFGERGFFWYAFDDDVEELIIYVPRESVNAYKSAEGWSDYANHIVGYDF